MTEGDSDEVCGQDVALNRQTGQEPGLDWRVDGERARTTLKAEGLGSNDVLIFKAYAVPSSKSILTTSNKPCDP